MIRRLRGQSCLVLALLLPLLGCVANRSVGVGDVPVARSLLTVTPASTWQRLPVGLYETRWEEIWTRNGPQIDRMAFIGGLPEGRAITLQRDDADQQVPVFRADMTAQDLLSMVEVYYRINGVAMFNLESVEPVDFLGGPGIKARFDYASGLGIAKKGKWVMRVVDGKLYAMKLEGVAEGFEAVASEFDHLVSSARLGR